MSKKWAAGVLATLLPLAGGEYAGAQQPPAKVKAEDSKARVKTLMSKLYDLQVYGPELGMKDMVPAPEKTALKDEELTKKDDFRHLCARYGVAVEAVASVKISGHAENTLYQFIDKDGEVYAQTVVKRMAASKDGSLQGTYWKTDSLQYAGLTRIGYHQPLPNPPDNWIVLSYNPEPVADFRGPSFNLSQRGPHRELPYNGVKQSLSLVEEVVERAEKQKSGGQSR